MFRTALATFAIFVSVSVAHAADPHLPTGTWSVAASKDALVITEVANDGTVKAKLIGLDVTGTWKKGVLTLSDGKQGTIEARLLAEPLEKGKVKYTLTGTHTIFVTAFPVEPDSPSERKTGWYAQMTADAPPVPQGEIKAEIRGVLVEDGVNVYVSVKHKDTFGKVQETRIWLWKSEGEWKVLQHTLKPMDGKEIVVNATLAQLPKGHTTSIPEGALYFLGKFEPKLANPPKE